MRRILQNKRFTLVQRKGFTLIELLVVIAIISILASILLANFVGVRQRGRDAQRKSDARQIQSALEMYRADNGNYPTALVACGSPFSSGSSTYMSKVPCDPLSTTTSYTYSATPVGCDNTVTTCTGYTIIACIENANDSQKDSVVQSMCSGSGSTGVSFTVTNP